MATKTNKNTGTQRRQRNRRRQRQRGNNVTTRVVIPPASGGVIYSNPSMPNFRTYGDSTIVRNTEVVSNVAFNAGAGLFAGFSDALIAELPGWLTQLADLYSKWRWRALTVIYIPSCPTSTSGRVAMCMSYDRNDAAATTVTQITQGYKAIVFPPYAGYEGAHVLNSGRNNNVAGAICMEVDITRFDKMWYPTINGTAFSALATTIQNSYCPCSYVIGSDGGPAGAAAGNIYLKYEIEFIEPINPTMNVWTDAFMVRNGLNYMFGGPLDWSYGKMQRTLDGLFTEKEMLEHHGFDLEGLVWCSSCGATKVFIDLGWVTTPPLWVCVLLTGS